VNDTKYLSSTGKALYGLGDLSSAFTWAFVSSYLTLFYTDMVGLRPAVVSGIFLTARILDIISDPAFGAIADNTHTKWGRFRPYILFGSPVLAVFAFLAFTAPFRGNIIKTAWATFTYIVTGMLYSVVNLSYGSIGAVMSFNPRERDELNSWRFTGNYLGKLILGACTIPLILVFGGGDLNKSGFTKTALLYSIISVPLWMIFFKTSREIIHPASVRHKVEFTGSLKTAFQNRPLLILMGTLLFYYIGSSAHATLWLYYMSYNVKRIDLIPYLTTFASIAGIAGIYMGKVFMHKISKKKIVTVSYAIYIALYLGFYFNDPSNITVLIIIQISGGILAFCNPAIIALLPDCIDYAEGKTGKRSDGIAYSFFNLVIKLGMAIGPAAGLILMAGNGYQAQAVQTKGSLGGINFAVNFMPAICLAFSIVILSFYDLNSKEMRRTRERLLYKRYNQGIHGPENSSGPLLP
jgi:GPH family glycoside/pentoside/hexuronide:cation symporter/probable glucitol transport protein GutA